VLRLEHRHEMDSAIAALREERRGEIPFASEIRLLSLRAIRARQKKLPPAAADLLQLAQLADLTGAQRFKAFVEQGDPLLEKQAADVEALLADMAAARLEAAKEKPRSAGASSLPDPPAKQDKAAVAQAAPRVPLRRLAEGINLVHKQDHYHLYLPMQAGGVLDLDVPGDGSCFTHAVAWGEILGPRWAAHCGRNPKLTAADARRWFTTQIADLAEQEMTRSAEIRTQLATYMETHLVDYRTDITFAIANIIHTARWANPLLPPAEWQFRGVGEYFSDVLAGFFAHKKNRDAVLDAGQDLVRLVSTEPLLINAYLECVRTDTGMWTGGPEARALTAMFREQKAAPINLMLYSAAPLADMVFDVDEAIARAVQDEDESPKKGSKGEPKQEVGGNEEFDVPKFTYAALGHDTIGFLLADVIAQFPGPAGVRPSARAANTSSIS
jgi:hypothetical protein